MKILSYDAKNKDTANFTSVTLCNTSVILTVIKSCKDTSNVNMQMENALGRSVCSDDEKMQTVEGEHIFLIYKMIWMKYVHLQSDI